ncbi:MAG TPA: tetratricopeptide repeat protein [Herpetosiphonaceae bacterium]
MPRLPKGTVTFLCAALPAPDEHHLTLARKAIDMQGGQIFKAEPAALFAVFPATLPAVQAALSAQRHIRGAAGQDTARQPAIAIHRGKAEEHRGTYVGAVINRAQSLLAAGHPGQVLISAAGAESLANLLPAEISLRDLGAYRLRDLVRTEHIFQIEAPGLPADHPALTTLDARPHNLPVLLSPLIGRERDVRAVRELLARPDTRQVTLQGASGTGKTRLALQIAVEQIDEFTDGAYFVSLAPVSDPGLVIAEIGQVLGIKEQSSQRLADTIAEALGDLRVLLVLDNFEQVSAAAGAVAQLLANTRQLKIIVTSQQALSISGEQVFAVPPLAMPETGSMAPEELSRVPAVALFLERAREAQPAFAFTPAVAPAVAELCTRLEGLPLAIELVAAQSKRYLPPDMLVLLNNHLAVTRARRRGNTREDILRPVLDWICEVLGPGSSALFARLGVFVGGCTAESAGAICNPGDELGLDVGATLALLLDNHLLLREELKEQRVRYTMLDAVHEYAGQRLQKRRELERLQAAHAAYYAELAEKAYEGMIAGQQQHWLGRLEGTYHNLRAALTWSQANDPALLARLAGGLVRYWYIHGDFSEGRLWLERTLAALEQPGLAEPNLEARLRHNLGLMMYAQGDFEPALGHTLDGLALREASGDRQGIVLSLNNLGLIAMAQGRYDQARDFYERGLASSREISQRPIQISLLGNLGLLALYALRFDEALGYFGQGLALAVELSDRWAQAMTIYNMGLVAFFQNDAERCLALEDESIAIAREIGNEVMVGHGLLMKAAVAVGRGQTGPARDHLLQALALLQRHGAKGGLVEVLEVWADVLAAEGSPLPAATIFGATLAAYANHGAGITPANTLIRDQIEGRIRRQLATAEYERAWEEGRRLSLQEALEYAQANG